MAIIGLQRRFREVGRIRMGVQVPTRSGKRAPRKLDHFRLTSPDRAVIEAVAAVYGGSVKEWDNDGSAEWEVAITASELRIALPPNVTDLGFSQYYEAGAKGYCTRRCDTVRDTVRDVACDCDPDDRTCKATTRLTVLLPDVPGLGTWRLESHGWNAAVELSGAVELIEQLAGVRSIVPARLRLDHREKRKLVNGKAEVYKFAVPVIDLDVSIQGVRQLAANSYSAVGSVDDLSALDQAPPSGWKPIPAVEAPLALTVEAQVKEHEQAKPPAKKRANAAAPLPPTGRAPRTAAQAAGDTCDICSKPYGSESLMPNPDKSPGASRYIHRSHKTQPAETGGDSAPSVPASEPVAEPVPAGRPEKMTPKMRSKAMAMIAGLFPIGDMTPSEGDDYRRQVTLDICAALGSPGFTSRGEIDKDTGMVLIDTLQAIEDEEVVYDVSTGRLAHTATGEIIGFARGES